MGKKRLQLSQLPENILRFPSLGKVGIHVCGTDNGVFVNHERSRQRKQWTDCDKLRA